MEKRMPLSSLGWRQRLYIVVFHSDTPAGKAFDAVLLSVILASLLVVMLDSVVDIHRQYGAVLWALEWFFTVIFLAEYLVRIYCHPKPARYIFSFYGLIDLFSVLPAFIALLLSGTQYLIAIRVIRMLRVFRILKMTHYLAQANFLAVALRSSQQKIVVFFISVCSLIVVFGTLMYVIEGPENGFTSIPISVYWAVVTLTTVGFGDIVPHTALGKALASLVMIMGYSIIAVPTGIFTAELANSIRPEAMQHRCPQCGKGSHEPGAVFCCCCGTPLFRKLEPQD